jgi:hypothetical protein
VRSRDVACGSCGRRGSVEGPRGGVARPRPRRGRSGSRAAAAVGFISRPLPALSPGVVDHAAAINVFQCPHSQRRPSGGSKDSLSLSAMLPGPSTSSSSAHAAGGRRPVETVRLVAALTPCGGMSGLRAVSFLNVTIFLEHTYMVCI